MPYIVDGHNLIPKVGLKLDALDDELQLVAILREFCRIKRKRIEVYFDGAPAGANGVRKFGYVTAHFVRKGRTADDAIRDRLRKMGNAARNWTVVSSDREVLFSAKAVRASRISSDEFARQIDEAKFSAVKSPAQERALSAQEIRQWLEIFSASEDEKE